MLSLPRKKEWFKITRHQLFTVDFNKKITNKQALKLPNLDIKSNRLLQHASKAKFYKPLIVYGRHEINCKHVAIYCCCTAWFVSDLVGNTENIFFRISGHMSPHNCLYMKPWSYSQVPPMAEWLRPLSFKN